jgi:hypothetical protein
MPAGAASTMRSTRAGVNEGQRGGDPAAERRADDRHPLDAQRVEQVHIVEDEIVDAVEPIGALAVAEAGVIRRDDVEVRRQGVVIGRPHARRELRVQHQQRVAAPAAHDVRSHTAHVEKIAAVRHRP